MSELGMNIVRYLQFSLGNENYAIDLMGLKEVIPLPETTELPNCPPYYVGIMNLRGHIISIIDLRKKLNIKRSEEELEEAVIIVELQGVSLGLVVDTIGRVLNIEESQVTSVPEVSSQLNAQYINGVYQGDDFLTIILDIEKILKIKEITEMMSRSAS